MIPLTILKCINNQKIPLYGDGLNVRDWLYVEDHVDAIILAATEGRNGETYCIGGDKELSNKELILKICNILDKELPENKPYSSLINYVKDRPGHDRRYAIDSSKIKKELGWHAKYSFDDALLLTVKWYLENQVWCEELISKSGH